MNKSHLLINEQALQVLPSLALALGLEEAIVIQQLHYWLNNPKNEGRVDDEGNKWVYNTYAEWKEDNFPFWSEDKIQRIFLSLQEQGVVIARQLDAKRRDMKKFYRIDYEKLCAMDDSILRPSNTANLHDVKMNQRIPENTETVLSEKDLEQVNAKVDYIISQNDNSKAWQGREMIREDLLHFADWYNKTTGQSMPKRAQKSWWKALDDWKAEGLTISDLQEAYNARSKWRTVSDPNELTKDAAAIHSLPAGKENDNKTRTSLLRTI